MKFLVIPINRAITILRKKRVYVIILHMLEKQLYNFLKEKSRGKETF